LSKKFAVVITPASGCDALPKLESLSEHAHSITAFVHVGPAVEVPQCMHLPTVKMVSVESTAEYYAALNRALFPSINADIPVLFVSPEYIFDYSAVTALQEGLAADPLYGFALPRTNVGGSAPIPRVRGDSAIDGPSAFDEFLGALPVRLGGGIVQAVPVLVRASVLYNFGHMEGWSFNLSDALARLFIRSNRRGFSGIVCNRALFFAPEQSVFDGPQPRPIINRASDYYRALDRLEESPEQRAQKLLWCRLRNKSSRKVLFDIRNLAPGYNGTAHHILSLIKPLCEVAERFNIEPTFWVSEQSAEYHQLDKIAHGSFVFKLTDDDLFDASIRLSQPWSFSELRDQAYRSMVNMYLIMDAIAWDCYYIRMPHIDGVWRTAADYSDGFVYNSRFTQQVFQERFPKARKIPSLVAYCSLDPLEYYTPEFDSQREVISANTEPYVLVVGNEYYHKGLYEVVRVIATGFPETRFKVLGEIGEQYPNVDQISSGRIPNDEIDRLFRRCTCLVFPSYYEGFGLPVIKALSFGKPVIARQSDLLDEIRDCLSPVDSIVSFTRKSELLRAIDDILSREPYWRAQDSQAVSPRQHYGWTHAANDILALIDQGLQTLNVERCISRLDFFYRSAQFDIERSGWTNADQNKIIFEVEREE